MGMRRMTFEIPEEVAERFESEVPVLVAQLLRPQVSPVMTADEWAAAASAANADEQLNADIHEWQAFSDPIEEPWNAPSPR
jgi:hypothetical protein